MQYFVFVSMAHTSAACDASNQQIFLQSVGLRFELIMGHRYHMGHGGSGLQWGDR